MNHEDLNVTTSNNWGTTKTLRDIANAYSAVYEAKKKVDQDEDGDNDFADVRVARMVASGMTKAQAIAAVRNKEYNEEFELDEGIGSAIRGLFSKKKEEEAPKPQSRGDQLRARYNVGPEKSDTSAKRQILNRAKGNAERAQTQVNMGNASQSYANKAKEAHNSYLKAGYSKYGADLPPTGRGNKARKRAAADRVLKSMKKEELELWVNELIEEGYDLSEYTWDEMAEIYLDEATRMRKELGKEGEIATRKELASRSNAYQRSGSVDKTIAAAERRADRPYIKPVRDESKSDYNKRLQKSSDTMSKLAASRRGSVRDKPRAGLRGYDAAIKGIVSDKELQNSRRSAMAAGTPTPREKKQLNREAYEAYELVASYLLENNFATTVEDANQIINNMSENWFDSIIEEKKPLPVAKMKRKEEKLDKELGSEMSKVLRTEIDSPERKELLRKNRRFGDMHDVRRSVSTRGGKRPLPMPEVGRYKPKDED